MVTISVRGARLAGTDKHPQSHTAATDPYKIEYMVQATRNSLNFKTLNYGAHIAKRFIDWFIECVCNCRARACSACILVIT